MGAGWRRSAVLVGLLSTGCVERAYRHYQACAIPASTPAACSASGWCWENPLPHGNAINAVWASDPDNVWTVAGSGLITHWDGTQWGAVASGTDQRLLGLWGSSPQDIWAVGEGGTMLHWECAGWGPVAGAPSSTDSATLRGVWGTSSNDAWVVGDDGAFHWNGSAWDAQPAAGTGWFGLNAVWGDRPNDYWAVGQAGAVHFDGTGWSGPEATGALPLTAVWGGGGQLWAAGNGAVLRREANGAWLPSLTCAGTTFLAVWGGAQDVLAAGTGGALWESDGSAGVSDCVSGGGPWHPVSLTSFDLRAGINLAAESWVVGAGGTVGARTSGAWQLQAGGHPARLDALWTGTDGVLAAGTSDQGVGGFWLRSGEAWRPDAIGSGTPGRVTSLSGRSATDLWAVDDSGQVWHRGTGGWSVAAVLAGYSGQALFETDTGTLWTAGGSGQAYQANASSPPAFTADSTGLGSVTLFALWGVGGQMWGTGAGGALFASTGGGGWAPVSSGSNSDMFGLWADGASGTFFSVGQGGALTVGAANNLVTYDGQPTPVDLHGVWGSSASDVWAVGDQGKVLHYDASQTWSLMPSPTDNGLRAVQGVGSDLWVVGESASVLHRR